MRKWYVFLQTLLILIFLTSTGYAAPAYNTYDGNLDSGWESVIGGSGDWSDKSISGASGDGWTAGDTWESNGRHYNGGNWNVNNIGVYTDNDYLYFGLETGFDLKNGEKHYNDNTYAGDIALDFDSDGSFEFGINFDFNGSNQPSLNIYKVDSWKTTNTMDNKNNYQYDDRVNRVTGSNGYSSNSHYSYRTPISVTNGSAIGNSSSYFVGFDEANNSVKTNTIEGAIDLDLLNSELSNIYGSQYKADDVAILWTMSCGNDVLDATGSITNTPPPAVPEPSTYMLFGFGLIGLSALGRRKKSA